MAAITMQRDLVVELKKETVLNLELLSKLKGMQQDISRQVFKENALEKPTQNLFYHLSHYFVCIIDPKASDSFPWPLYDSNSERSYRNELASFISNYSSKGVLAPVMASYLVNPNCYKVTLLIFQLSQLAIQKLLESKMKKDSQKRLYNEMTAKYKSHKKDDFIEQVENEMVVLLNKFSSFLHKRKSTEKIAEKIRTKISDMESKLASVKAQAFLDEIVDKFISEHKLNSKTKDEILKIKDVHKSAPFFDWWLSEVDRRVDEMESKWSEKMSPFIKICNETKSSTELLISRHMGEAEKNTYMIEYNHKTDEINTNVLQSQVNSQQKYVLKNIIKDGKLDFTNLIRGFLIAISYVLRNAEMGNEIYKFNEYLKDGARNYGEVLQSLKALMKRIENAEVRLQTSSRTHIVYTTHFPEIPPLPDLSDLRCTREQSSNALFESFTPISMSKQQFNLWRRTTTHTFVQSQPKIFTPFQTPKYDFLKHLNHCRVNLDFDTTQNFHNLSIIPSMNNMNETIAGCMTGCTKQQLMRLLSTKKTSSSKKMGRSNKASVKMKKTRLFNESSPSNEGSKLFRSYSSPNLYENRELRTVQRSGCRKLSIMQENYSTLLEVSGIVSLVKDSSNNSSNQDTKTGNVPTIAITESSPNDQTFHANLKHFNIDLDKELLIENVPKSKEFENVSTPRNNPKLINKTNSLEKIINRYKNIRASVRSEDYIEKCNDIQTIAEEKENMFTANKNLLPDLLSPNFSGVSNTSEDFEVHRNPRESLGTALGVDTKFLDQFNLID